MGGGQCRCCGSFLDPHQEHAETCSTAEATRGHYACVHAVVCGVQLADPGITTERRGRTASQSRPAAVPGRSAALDVCVASSIAAAARGDAAHDRKVSHYRNEIGELMQQGIHHSPLVWTADAAASSRHSNASARGRHRLQPKRAVGEIPSSQVENNPGVSELRVGDLYAGRLGASLRDPLFLEC